MNHNHTATALLTRLMAYAYDNGEFIHAGHCAHVDTFGEDDCNCGLSELSAEISQWHTQQEKSNETLEDTAITTI